MRRRKLLVHFGGGLAYVLGARSLAKRSSSNDFKRNSEVGHLDAGSIAILAYFINGLRELGYEPGRNIVLEFRYAEGQPERLSELLNEVLAQNVDIIVVESIAAAVLAKKASQTIPIVVAIASDPVGAGVFASFARPGGNATGLSLQSEEITAKRIQLITDVVARAATMAVLYNPNRPTIETNIKETEVAARKLGLQVRFIPVGTPDNLPMALEQMASGRPEVVMTLPDGMLLSLAKPIGA